MNTPAEQFQLIVGRLIIEKGGEDFIKDQCKAYHPEERNDRSRLKKTLLKALERAKNTNNE